MNPAVSKPVVLRAEGDHYLNPWMAPQTGPMIEIVKEAIHQLQSYEEHEKTRKRARRSGDKAIMEGVVTALICAATVHHIAQLEGRLKVSRSHRVLRKDRYKTPLNTTKLPDFLDALSAPEIPWLDQQLGVQTPAANAPVTTIAAGERLKKRIEVHGIRREDVIRSDGGELIELRASKSKDAEQSGRLVDYDDTEQTIAWRKQMEKINRYLLKADLKLDGAVGADIWDRGLRRVFNNNSFQQGGRLYGGFWQPMSKKERFEHLQIDGKPVIELDYGQVATRILYGRKEQEPPEGDLYEIEGADYPRSGMKKILNALLYSPKTLNTWPSGTVDLFRDPKTGDHPPFKQVKEALLEKHKTIRDSFETGEGMEVMFLESEILIDVLETLRSEDITALPIHDAILVSEGNEDLALKAMESSFLKLTGVPAKVSLELGP